MAESSRIEWTDHTFNPWIGCTKVGPGCDHCYAESAFDHRRHIVTWGQGNERRLTSEQNWAMPLRWQRGAARFRELHGRRQRVFCASLADVFDNEVPPTWRERLFSLIEQTPDLDWLLLTKRIGNAYGMMFAARGGHLPLLKNLWIGATIVNQTEAERDIPKLRRTPAAVRFISAEPLLAPLNLERNWGACESGTYPSRSLSGGGHQTLADCVDWVICGGESGPKARPMAIEWARDLRDQCNAYGVAFFFKQWGTWGPDGARRSKAANGRLLDGRTWDELPARPADGGAE